MKLNEDGYVVLKLHLIDLVDPQDEVLAKHKKCIKKCIYKIFANNVSVKFLRKYCKLSFDSVPSKFKLRELKHLIVESCDGVSVTLVE